jgi:hypothetical protein
MRYIRSQQMRFSSMTPQTSDNKLAADHAPLERAATQPWRAVIDNPWLMILTLFFVTAALGLPFLWISRGFSTLSKVLLTIAVLVWTALVFWGFYLIMAWCIPRIMDGLRALNS